ncbi:penicillin acylase family protein [Flavisolibacter sp. BT320]|nr:penicillin acylase family protein [Flavisolibacter longurius]
MLTSFRYCVFLSLTVFYISSSAQVKKSLLVTGLKAPVEVLRDQWGVNHIYASNQHDLFFTQGYCAAKDRLFQFEIWRRQATGTVAEILGASEVKRDIGTRLFRYRGDMKKELAHYHKNGEAIITAYVAGVNAYIEEALQNPKNLPMEFGLLGIKPGKWTPDVVISRHQGLLSNVKEELTLGRAVARAGAETVKDLKWFHPKVPDLRLDPSITAAMLSKNILELYDASRSPIVFRKASLSAAIQAAPVPSADVSTDGSNNWIISGKRTASGYPILANDPHRSITLPSLRYMVHLVAPGWNVIGGGEPVIPGVSIGHNEQGAWGLTIFETDGEDLYVYDLNPDNLLQYRYKNKWVAMTESLETIPVRDSASVQATLRYTVHGPVTYIDTANQKAYAIRCAWLEPGGAPYLASLRMNQARNWKDFRKASQYSHIPGENMIWADRNGNIGWQVVGITPIRKNFSGMVPVPGDGRYEWKGYLNIKKRPHQYNPAKGFLATANENVTPEDYKYWNNVHTIWADPYRGNRIREVLASDSSVTVEETVALQTDYYSLTARTLVPMLRHLSFADTLAQKAKEEILNWNYVLDKSSVAAGIYAMWERKLYVESGRFVPKELKGLVTIQLSKLVAWLQAPDSRFDHDPQKGRDAFLQETFTKAINDLSSKLGNRVTNWTYGQQAYKHTALLHPLNAVLTVEQKKKLNLGPIPRGGNSHTPNTTGSLDRQSHGASFRFIADLSDWDKTLMMNTPGQSADPRSPYYSNLFALWAADGYFPAYFSREKIESVTDSVTTLVPARGQEKEMLNSEW